MVAGPWDSWSETAICWTEDGPETSRIFSVLGSKKLEMENSHKWVNLEKDLDKWGPDTLWHPAESSKIPELPRGNVVEHKPSRHPNHDQVVKMKVPKPLPEESISGCLVGAWDSAFWAHSLGNSIIAQERKRGPERDEVWWGPSEFLPLVWDLEQANHPTPHTPIALPLTDPGQGQRSSPTSPLIFCPLQKVWVPQWDRQAYLIHSTNSAHSPLQLAPGPPPRVHSEGQARLYICNQGGGMDLLTKL